MIKIVSLLICLFGVIANLAMGQSVTRTLVSGIVVEASTQEPVEFVEVVLVNAEDSLKVQATISQKDGRFLFKEIPVGRYFIQTSFIGFKSKITDIIPITADVQELKVGKIEIEVNDYLLDEVEIVAEKSTYELGLDRRIFNVEKDLMSQSSSATEILQNIPSITVDIDGQVSLRGTSNITFFINGRPSPLMRANSTAALQQIPANTIERIEVITNPSAKYKPDGAGGIINIVLKEKSLDGLNGTVQGNVGNLDRYNANLTLNFNTGKMNVFGSYGIRHASTPKVVFDQRIEKDLAGNILSTSENNTIESKDKLSHIFNGGLDFTLSEKSQLEISGSYYIGREKLHSITDWNQKDNETAEFSVNQDQTENEEEYEINAGFEHEFGEDHTLAISLTHASYDEAEDIYYSEKHLQPDLFDTLTHNLIQKGGPMTEFAIEYAVPLGEDTELEAGYVAEFLTDDIRLLNEGFAKKENSWTSDLNKTNQFIFTQNIHAAYATLGKSVGDLSFLAGLRAEQALVNSNLISTKEEIPNNYFKLYPTLHLSYELGDSDELMLTYSKRVKRADSDEHNPFPEYKDPRNRESGNPLLKPEQIHSLELGYQMQKENLSFIPTFYYRYKYDAFAEIDQLIGDTIHTSYINLSNETSAGLELILTGSIRDILRFTLSGNAFYNELDVADLNQNVDTRSIISWNSKLAANTNLTSSTYLQINTYYRAARLTSQGQSNPLFLLNLGLRQDLFNKKASVVLTISDVFASLQWEKTIDTPELYRYRKYKRNRQIVYLGFTYRFGKAFKNKETKLDFEDNI